MGGRIITLNAGSSSMKFAVFEAGEEPELVLRGQVDRINQKPFVALWNEAGASLPVDPAIRPDANDRTALVGDVMRLLAPWAEGCIAVGHRVVHGGVHFDRPAVVDDVVVAAVERLAPFAPLHQPFNLAGIRAAQHAWPDACHVASFDTAFHRTIPEVDQMFAIPAALTEEGVRRFGFHGLSYESIARQLPRYLGERARGRVIVAHLGSGASLCGLVDGKSRITTMGMTPLDGLVMGTRPGRLDPGVLLFLLQEKRMSVSELSGLLHRQCGLLGLSGISAEMRDLVASETAEAKRAIDVFVSRLVAEIGGVAATIGGIDAMVFTGGIGEHAATVRAQCVARLAWLGARLDAARNAESQSTISAEDFAFPILVLRSDEERVIARNAYRAAVGAPQPLAVAG